MSDRDYCRDCCHMHQQAYSLVDGVCTAPVPDWALPPPMVKIAEARTCPVYQEHREAVVGADYSAIELRVAAYYAGSTESSTLWAAAEAAEKLLAKTPKICMDIYIGKSRSKSWGQQAGEVLALLRASLNRTHGASTGRAE